MKRGEALERELRANYQHSYIDGYRLTHHATRRLLERKIHADWIREALRCESRPGAQDGTLKYVGPYAMACINFYTNEIITVGYGLYNQPHLRLV